MDYWIGGFHSLNKRRAAAAMLRSVIEESVVVIAN